MHNDSKSNPADEVSPRVTANTFIRNGLWVEGANFLLSLEPEWEDCAQEYVIGQILSLPPGLLTKKQHLFQEKTATSSVFDKCFLGSLEIRIPSFAAGAPEMIPPKEKLTVGDTVIVADESTPKSIWAIGRIADFSSR